MATILGEAKNECCKLGVLVLSDDFFANTRNPMLELATFVEHKVDLLPLFYKLSVAEFKEERRRERWYEKWRTWVAEDDAVIAQWKDALRTVNTITGLEFCKVAPDEKMYIDFIVDKVCEILPIDLSHSSESFQGKERLCKFVAEMFERAHDESLHKTDQSQLSTSVDDKVENRNLQLTDAVRKQYTRRHSNNIQHDDVVTDQNMVAGVYGFGGTGKSSLCKALCDSYFSEFKGRVCHIEMGSDGSNSLSRLTKVLSRCFDNQLSRTCQLDEEQLWNLLRFIIRSSNMKPVFLCIDNVVAEESIDEAEKYLQCGPNFPKGSKIFLTARNLRALQRVTRHKKPCVLVKMPALEFHEARDVFLQKMGTFDHEESDSQVNQCVRLCTLNMGKDDFHPLMLISLAAYLAGRGELYSVPLMWKGVVAELSSDRCSALERVFKVVDLIYRDLSPDERSIYIDLALYFPHVLVDIQKRSLHGNIAKSWLCGLYYDKIPASKVEKILGKLETCSLIQTNDYGFYILHDLLKDFAKSKVDDESNTVPRRFVLENCEVDSSNHTLEGNGSYITRVAISKCAFRHDATLDLSKFDRLEVLHLLHNRGIDKVILSHEVFQRKLRSLIVMHCVPVTVSLLEETSAHEGKQPAEESINRLSWIALKNCDIRKENRKRSWMPEFLNWSANQSIACMAFKRLVSLRMTDVQGLVFDNLGECPLLEELYLAGVAVKAGISINCPRLKSLDLRRLTNIKAISGLDKSPGLQDISIFGCKKLQSLSIPDPSHSLVITECPALERIGFCCLLSTAAGHEVCQERLPSWIFYRCERLNELGRGECKLYLQRDQTVRKPACNLVEWAGNNTVESKVNLGSNFKLIGGGSGSQPGFASLSRIEFRDAQHTSLLVSALHVGNARHLENLHIRCTKKAGGCGCDLEPPAFDLLGGGPERLFYCCSRVRDLSCLGQCGSVKSLYLSGCGSVERWPEFAHMSSLTDLGLSDCTSLSQWPAIPWRVEVHEISGCINLPCEELLKPIMFSLPPAATEEDLLSYSSTLKGALWAVRIDMRQKTRDWCSIIEAMRPNSPQLLSMLLQKRNTRVTPLHELLYNQRAVVSKLLYDMTTSSESDCYSRFGYGYPPVQQSCKETQILSFLKPLLAATQVVTTFLQEFLNVPMPQRWTITQRKVIQRYGDDDRIPYYCLKRSEQLNLVLVGLVSIKMFNISVDEGLADVMAQIVQSFVSREDRSMQGEHDVMEQWSKDRLYYYKLLVMRVKDAVCRMASVPAVAERLGESFMVSSVYSDLQERVAQEYASYLDGSLYANLAFHIEKDTSEYSLEGNHTFLKRRYLRARAFDQPAIR